MAKGSNQQSVGIGPIHFHNNDHINTQLDNTGNSLVELQPKQALHSVVYSISEVNSSYSFNLLIYFKQSRWWGMNVMNDK